MMIKSGFVRNIVASAALSLGANQAYALCSAPVVEFPTDLIIQLSSANGQAMIGTAESVDTNSVTARSRGAMFFDSSSGGVMMCDGTDWVAPFSGGSSGPSAADQQYTNYGNFEIQSPYGNHGNLSLEITESEIPEEQRTYGYWKVDAYARGRDCDAWMELDDGTRVKFGKAMSQETYADRGQAGSVSYSDARLAVTIEAAGDGTYRWRNSITNDLLDPSVWHGKFSGKMHGTGVCGYLKFQGIERLR
jgi:hypothetical protein